MTGRHWALLAACLAGIGGMFAALHDWTEAMKPSFVGGALVVIGTQLGAIFSDSPRPSEIRRFAGRVREHPHE